MLKIYIDTIVADICGRLIKATLNNVSQVDILDGVIKRLTELREDIANGEV